MQIKNRKFKTVINVRDIGDITGGGVKGGYGIPFNWAGGRSEGPPRNFL